MFRAPRGVRDNLIQTALKLLANQHDGDSLVKVLVTGLQQRSRLKVIAELRKFITMDSRQAVKTGDLEKTQESLPVVKPQFTADFPEAVVREGADELTLRAEEQGMLRTFIDTADVGESRWRPPLDWHAARPSRKSSRERSGKNCTVSFWKLARRVNLRLPSTSRKAEVLWKVRDAKANGEEYYNQGCGRHIDSGVAVRQAMWEEHLQSPVFVSTR